MDKKTTHDFAATIADAVELTDGADDMCDAQPSQLTLMLIRQFARACNYDKALGSPLGLFVAN